MRDNYTAFYGGTGVSQGEYGKVFTVFLKDAWTRDESKKYFTAIFTSNPKKLIELKPKHGDLITFNAEINESNNPPKMVRPTKFENELFVLDNQQMFKVFYKNFDNNEDQKNEIFMMKRLWRHFPDENFWKRHEIGFKLNTLGFFLGKEQFKELNVAYHRFKNASRQQLPIKEKAKAGTTVLAPDLNLDYSKIKKPLINRF